MNQEYLSDEEVFSHLRRWKEAIAPFLKDCFYLEVKYTTLCLYKKGLNIYLSEDQGWVIYYSGFGYFQGLGFRWKVKTSDELLVIPEEYLKSTISSLSRHGFVKSALELLTSEENP